MKKLFCLLISTKFVHKLAVYTEPKTRLRRVLAIRLISCIDMYVNFNTTLSVKIATWVVYQGVHGI